MSDDDGRRWNERYSRRKPEFAPSADLVARQPDICPPAATVGKSAAATVGKSAAATVGMSPAASDGKPPAALELACGFGGNALFLAGLGYRVDAVDVSEVAIAALRAEIARRCQAGEPLQINATVADLDGFAPPAHAYDLIVVVRFLDRRLFAPAIAALKSGGLIYWETYVVGGRGAGRPSSPAFCLNPGELPQLCSGLETLHYCEDNGYGRAVILARKETDLRY